MNTPIKSTCISGVPGTDMPQSNRAGPAAKEVSGIYTQCSRRPPDREGDLWAELKELRECHPGEAHWGRGDDRSKRPEAGMGLACGGGQQAHLKTSLTFLAFLHKTTQATPASACLSYSECVPGFSAVSFCFESALLPFFGQQIQI